jgi:hypothetical protein
MNAAIEYSSEKKDGYWDSEIRGEAYAGGEAESTTPEAWCGRK